MHLLSRCNISRPKDSRPHLVWDKETSRVLVSNMARMATMPHECPQNQTTQSAQPSGNSMLVKRTVIKKKVPVSQSRQVNFMDAE